MVCGSLECCLKFPGLGAFLTFRLYSLENFENSCVRHLVIGKATVIEIEPLNYKSGGTVKATQRLHFSNKGPGLSTLIPLNAGFSFKKDCLLLSWDLTVQRNRFKPYSKALQLLLLPLNNNDKIIISALGYHVLRAVNMMSMEWMAAYFCLEPVVGATVTFKTRQILNRMN